MASISKECCTYVDHHHHHHHHHLHEMAGGFCKGCSSSISMWVDARHTLSCSSFHHRRLLEDNAFSSLLTNSASRPLQITIGKRFHAGDKFPYIPYIPYIPFPSWGGAVSSARWVAGKGGMVGRHLALALLLGGVAAFVRGLLSAFPPDFPRRWHRFVEGKPDNGNKGPPEEPPVTVLYDRHGFIMATLGPGSGLYGRSGANGRPLRPSDVPSFMWQAVVACEDRKFFQHKGIDPRGIARATLSLSSSGGGSTITQQLVKNVFLTNERKWARKVLEMILALLLEKRMSKWDILHTYLGKIYWGHGTYGIEAASAFYFGKHPSVLTLGECAMLAGIIPAPELLSPYRDPSRGKKPQARALRRMVEAGFIDASTAAAAVNEPLKLGIEGKEGAAGPWRAPFFVSEVLYELNQKYGRERVLGGGLRVHTTLDLAMQEVAEKSIRDAVAEYDNERVIFIERDLQKINANLESLRKTRQDEIDKVILKASTRQGLESQAVSLIKEKAISNIYAKFAARERILNSALDKYQKELKLAAESRLEAALVAIDQSNGEVRVLVGGRDYFESSFNRSTEAFRSPGSTFKPVVYLTALSEGLGKHHVLLDEPYTIGGFTPENYDRKFIGKVTLEESLVKSLNVPTVKLCAEVGVDKVCNMGKALGIESPLPYELSLALGGFELTPLQLATIYSTIAAGGIYHKPHLVARIESGNGQVIEDMKSDNGKAVVDEHSVTILRKLLQDVVSRGTGRAAQIGRPCGGKTGTSDGHRDVWFAGFTPDLSSVVWLGYDDNTPVGGLHPGTGSSHASPVWRYFMKSVHEGLPIRSFPEVLSDEHVKEQKRNARRSRRFKRNDLQVKSMEERIVWKDVWDWETASSVWEERERMEEWVVSRVRNDEYVGSVQAFWEHNFHTLGRGMSHIWSK